MLDQAIIELKRDFAKQAGRVEEMVSKSIRVLTERNSALAREIQEIDEPRSNRAELEIEAKAVEIIARFAPKAGNMRVVISIIKANKDLERIGDQAVNISKYASYLIERPAVKPLIDTPRMGQIAAGMIRKSLDAFVSGDPEPAYRTLKEDDLADKLYEQILRELVTIMAADVSTIERCMRLIMIAKNLERIADEATNLAEEFIYCINGEDVRHHEAERPAL